MTGLESGPIPPLQGGLCVARNASGVSQET